MGLEAAAAAGAKIAWDVFSRMWDALTKHRKTKDLQEAKNSAWCELLKGDKGDSEIIESAIARAKNVGSLSPEDIRLEKKYVAAAGHRKTAKKSSAKKSAKKGPAARKVGKKSSGYKK